MAEINSYLATAPAAQSTFLSDEAKRRLLAAQLLQKQAADTSAPVYTAGAGFAKLGAGLMGGLMEGYTESKEADRRNISGADFAQYLKLDQEAKAAAGSMPAAPVAAPMGSLPAMSSGVVPNDSNAVPGTVGMNQRLADLSQDFIDDNPGTRLSSGVRSMADQARLYANRANNPNPVAAPGTSHHETGNAVDIAGMTPAQRAALPSFGLAQPVANDPPHVELAMAADPSQQPYQVAGPAVAAPGTGTPQPSPQALAAALQNPQAAPTGPDRMALAAKLLSDPYTPPWAKEYIAKQMQPDNQLMQMPDGTVVSIDKRTNKAATVYQGAVKPAEVNGRLVNPQTGQVIADFSNPPTTTVGNDVVDTRSGKVVYSGNKAPTFGVIGEDNFGNKQYGWTNPADRSVTPSAPAGATPGAPVTMTGPDGKPITVPEGLDPKKFRSDVTSASADVASGKKTEVQAKSEKFGNKMELAERNLKDVEGEGQSYMGRSLEGMPGVGNTMATNWAKSESYQKYQQSRNSFITALLRDESGAAIGSDEFKRYERELFPQPGDGQGVIEQKRLARKIAIDGMKKAAGPGYKSPDIGDASKKTSSGIAWSVE